MAEHMDVAPSADATILDRFSMRGEDGEIRHEFVEEIADRIDAGDADLLRQVVAELHEADLGDLIGALAPEARVRLVELTGTDFDFSALNEPRLRVDSTGSVKSRERPESAHCRRSLPCRRRSR